MPVLNVTLIRGDKKNSKVDYRDFLPVNMYAVQKEILGAKGYMINNSGLTAFTDVIGTDRGGVYNERFSRHFRISGGRLIEIDSAGTVTNIGAISGSSQVAMPYSFNTQAIITDGRMWLYSPGGGLAEVVDADLGDPIDGVWIDGYYFLTDGEYIYHTDISDETAIDPLKFASAEFTPDPIKGLSKTQDNKVIVWGRYSIEYFVDVATDNFAFKRIETRAQKIGIVATHAKTELNGNFYIVGGRKNEEVSIHRISVGSSDKVSTREVDLLLDEYTEDDLADIRVESLIENGVAFVLFHLPDECLCFNETVAMKFGLDNAWSIIKSATVGDTPYRAINGIYDSRNGKWIYGDKYAAQTGYLDNSICTQYGDKVEWELRTPFINLETLSIDEIDIETITGFNAVNDATVALSLSYDGVSYGTEYWMTYSTKANYDKNFIARRLGYVSDWCCFKFRGVSTSRMAFALMKVTAS